MPKILEQGVMLFSMAALFGERAFTVELTISIFRDKAVEFIL